MNVEGILRTKGAAVVTIRPDATVQSLVEGLRDRSIGAMVVSEDDRTPVGIVSERDVVRALADFGLRTLQLQVSQLMTRSVITCAPTDTMKQLMSVMTTRRVRHLPVIRDGELAGIVSIGDVVKGRLLELETETNVLREAYMARK